MTAQRHDPMLDRMTVTELLVARLQGSEDLALRFMFREPSAEPEEAAPVQATPSLQLTRQQAKDLILLLAHGLGLPNTGIPDAPSSTPH